MSVTKVTRVVSLLPSATEMLCIIGGEHLLIGRNHEDDYPASITDRPILTGQKTTFTTSADVDTQVSTALSQGQSLYTLNTTLLSSLEPQVILTQDLCNVCAIDLQTVERVAQKMNPKPEVVTLNPLDLNDVLANVLEVGRSVGMEVEAAETVEKLNKRIARARDTAERELTKKGGKRPTVAFIEWTDPIYPGGHWTPQIIEMSGGIHVINPTTNGDGSSGAGPSRRMTEQFVIDCKPEILIVCPCGLNLEESKRETRLIMEKEWWKELMKSVQRVAVVDGNQMFNRPGPRLVNCLEWMVGYLWGVESVIPSGFPWEEWKM